jgi:hypothetical protein
MSTRKFKKYIFVDFTIEFTLLYVLIYYVIQENNRHMGRLSSISDGLKYSDSLTIFYTCIICSLFLYRNMYEFAIYPYERQQAWGNSKIIWGLIVARITIINVGYVSALLISSITTPRNVNLHNTLTTVVITCFIGYEIICLIIRTWYYFYLYHLVKTRTLYRMGIVYSVFLIVGMISSSLCFVAVICEDKPNKNIAEYILFYIPTMLSLCKLMDLVAISEDLTLSV